MVLRGLLCSYSVRSLTQSSQRQLYEYSGKIGTRFASTRLPLTTWFLAIHLLTQAKHGISSLELACPLDVSQNTARQLKHELMQAMCDELVAMAGIVQVDDTYWAGSAVASAAGKTP